METLETFRWFVDGFASIDLKKSHKFGIDITIINDFEDSVIVKVTTSIDTNLEKVKEFIDNCYNVKYVYYPENVSDDEREEQEEELEKIVTFLRRNIGHEIIIKWSI